ncbi:DUF6894 family protein [Methylobacterium planeticum]|uniref:DUF6894 domain-containing protein n=1 Tax=Methylobacterium planeticum TaxID=2615211 RepID=A0A6N6MWX1_9HYPH|nr:hypothetical protein [Methylobacterium planeticum]KAB1073599.1 hypothetical protein F6X51_10375 [Methylobacterium planeticum]
MPRYTFQVVVGDDVPAEPFVRVLANADAAWEAARGVIAELMAAGGDARLLTAAMVVTDEADEIVFELPFSEVLTVQSGRKGPVH